MVLENGKLTKKKQPYYADNLERKKKNAEVQSPGPGFYEDLQCFDKTQSKGPTIFSKAANNTENIAISKPGPGEYDIKLEQIKPRVKGISEWKRPNNKKTLLETNSFQGTETVISFEIPRNYYVSKKQLSSFASKVPRFHEKSKLKPIRKNKFSMNQENRCFLITKSEDPDYETVYL